MSASLFGGGGAAKHKTKIAGIPVQKSLYGAVIPVVFGTCRVGGNLMWYGDFKKKSGSGNKVGNLLKDLTGSDVKSYSAAVAILLCEGGGASGINDVTAVWSDKTLTTPAALALNVFRGTYPQTPWGYLTTNHTAQALGYNGLAYLATVFMDLGTSGQLPNLSFEVRGLRYSVTGTADADASLVLTDILSDPHFGAGFPGALIGDLTQFQNYVLAQGLLISVAYEAQQSAGQVIDDLVQSVNCEVVWNGGTLNVVPRGDTAVTANGRTYTPVLTPVATLTTDDFQSRTGEEPVTWNRKRASDVTNSLKLEWINRQNFYITDSIDVKNQAFIDLYGVRQETAQGHMFVLPDAATASAQLRLKRSALVNSCKFSLDARWAALDPMDMVTVPDPVTGDPVLVRITEISENDDDTLSFTAEQFMQGAGTVVAVGIPGRDGYVADYGVDPGTLNTPLVWEPPVGLVAPPINIVSVPQVWLAASGGDDLTRGPFWGGANVWMSLDGVDYAKVGVIPDACTQGALVGALATYVGTNPDSTNTPVVNLSRSGGQLPNSTLTKAQVGIDQCLVDDEIFTYVTSSLTGTDQYTLSTIFRGIDGSRAASHLNGAPFTWLDGNVLKIQVPISTVGSTVYFKFQGFNLWGGGVQSLASCTAYPHNILGSSLFGPVASMLASGTSLDCGLTSETVSQTDVLGSMPDPYAITVDLGAIP